MFFHWNKLLESTFLPEDAQRSTYGEVQLLSSGPSNPEWSQTLCPFLPYYRVIQIFYIYFPYFLCLYTCFFQTAYWNLHAWINMSGEFEIFFLWSQSFASQTFWSQNTFYTLKNYCGPLKVFVHVGYTSRYLLLETNT